MIDLSRENTKERNPCQIGFLPFLHAISERSTDLIIVYAKKSPKEKLTEIILLDFIFRWEIEKKSSLIVKFFELVLLRIRPITKHTLKTGMCEYGHLCFKKNR